ncbi:MAG: TVP38/TMEM64 family protein [Alphaproteobacteria bacterium TMED93]|nr:MAG: TVP38/TMEM64 family protein [Alphaproteobacteria bacterium TMED93]
MNRFKLFTVFTFLFAIVIISLFAVYSEYFSIEFFKTAYVQTKATVDQNYFFYLLVFFLVYFIVASLSLPIAGAVSVFIGSIFHFFDAFLLIAIASSLGASVCFLISKYTLKEFLHNRFKRTLKKINLGFKENGMFYLFFLRLVPIFPFFIINFLFGLTSMKLLNFFVVSFVGMMPGILLYVNAGSQISKINSTQDILSFKIISSFIMIGILPVVLKKIMYYFRLVKK